MRALVLTVMLVSSALLADDDYESGGGSAPQTQQQAAPQYQPQAPQNQGGGQPIIINTRPQNQFVPPRTEVFDSGFFNNANKPVDEPKTSKSPRGVVRPLDGVGYYQSDDWKAACAKFKDVSSEKYRKCYQDEKDKTLKAVDASINGTSNGLGKKLKPSPFEEAAKAAGAFDRD